MRTLIVCGTASCPTAHVQRILQAAGVAAPLPAASGSIAYPAVWHDRLFASHGKTIHAIKPGKAWELAAGEFFLANWNQELWGWADYRSTWLLEFWRDFDAGTRFVLLYTPAHTVLHEALADVNAVQFDSAAILDEWCATQAELLRFYLRNPGRCALVNADQSIACPAAFAVNLNEQLQLQLKVSDRLPLLPTVVNGTPGQGDALRQWLVQQLLRAHPAALELEQEILASLPRWKSAETSVGSAEGDRGGGTGQAEDTGSTRRGVSGRPQEQIAPLCREGEIPQLALAAAQLRALYKAQSALHGLQQTHKELQVQSQSTSGQLARQQEQTRTFENRLIAAERARDAEAKANAEVVARCDTLQEQTAQLEKAQQELQQENEMLVLQLHEIQKELEKHFRQSEAAQTQLAAAQEALDGESKSKADAIAECDEQRKRADQQDKAQRELRKENEQLLQQLHELREEQEKLFRHSGAVATQLAAAQAALHGEAKGKADAIAQLDTLRKQAEQHDQAQQELRGENELLLMQLHQVQEELERYFLKHQQAEQEQQNLQSRLQRLTARYPDFCEWERIELITGESAGTPDTAQWQVHGLTTAGRTVPVIDVSFAWTNAHAPALTLHPSAQGAATPLLCCLAGSELSAQSVTLQPCADPSSAAAAVLHSLAPSDMQLVQALCQALVNGLPASQPSRDAAARALQTFRMQLQEMPPAWRFDFVQLQHEQVNPDYEHLWFSVRNATFGTRQWPTFEFRLSAANVKKRKLSKLPKLEFPLPPEGDAKQFENWFEESEDDRGPKFELRFDLRTEGMDLNAWQALSSTDQAQALSMAASLPALLGRLEQLGTHISRPWSDWQQLAIGIQDTLQTRLGLRAAAVLAVQ